MALIGDVGTGKTMLCRALLRELPPDVQSALVLNPHLSDVELVGTILDDLGIERRGHHQGRADDDAQPASPRRGRGGQDGGGGPRRGPADDRRGPRADPHPVHAGDGHPQAAPDRARRAAGAGGQAPAARAAPARPAHRHPLLPRAPELGRRPIATSSTGCASPGCPARCPSPAPRSRASSTTAEACRASSISSATARSWPASARGRARSRPRHRADGGAEPRGPQRGAGGGRSRRSGRRCAASRPRRGSPGSLVLGGADGGLRFSGRSIPGAPAGAAALLVGAQRARAAPVALTALAGARRCPAPPWSPAGEREPAPRDPVRGLLVAAPAPLGRDRRSGAATVAAWPSRARAERSTSPRWPRATTSPPRSCRDATVGELRAVGLPALIGLEERGARAAVPRAPPRGRHRDRAEPDGRGARASRLDRLEAAWTRAAWVALAERGSPARRSRRGR